MLERRWRRGGTALHDHRHEAGQRDCLYETALRQAIADQHGLAKAERMQLRACEGCGKPYLLQSVRQPYAEEGELACPRCGVIAASWDGTQACVAFWQREHER
ncbi:MAG TPA: hypothetical protein VEQ11_11175 [Chloroflexota bacterium]|nr:hypothetical protein [Chloroflexota bacterium]